MYPVIVTQAVSASGRPNLRFGGLVSGLGPAYLAALHKAQRDYLLRCYLASPPPRSGGSMPSRMCAVLRRMAVLARRNGSGIPTLSDILIPAHNWQRGMSCIIIRLARGRDSALLPIVADVPTIPTHDEMEQLATIQNLDLGRPIYIEGSEHA